MVVDVFKSSLTNGDGELFGGGNEFVEKTVDIDDADGIDDDEHDDGDSSILAAMKIELLSIALFIYLFFDHLSLSQICYLVQKTFFYSHIY